MTAFQPSTRMHAVLLDSRPGASSVIKACGSGAEEIKRPRTVSQTQEVKKVVQ